MSKEQKAAESLVKYEPFSIEKAEEQHATAESSGGGNKFAELKEGKNKYRFLPALAGKTWCVAVMVHYVDLPGNKRKSINCPRTVGRRCVICERVEQLFASADAQEAKGKIGAAEKDRDEAKAMRAKRRCYANVVDRNAPQNGPMVLGFSGGVYRGPVKSIEESLLAIRKDREDGGDFTDPGPEGFDIVIEREGTGARDTRYTVKRARHESPLSEDAAETNAWIKNQNALERFCRVLTDKEIEATLRGEDVDDEDEDKPRRGAEPQRAAKRSTVEDDAIKDAEIEADDDGAPQGDEEIEID